MSRADLKLAANDVAWGVALLLLAAPVAFAIHVINNTWPGPAQTILIVTGGLFALLLAIPVAVYMLVRRRSADPRQLGLIVLAAVGVLLVGIYFYRVVFYVFFPADILIWSEGSFVGNILKFRLGYPLYSAQQNNESTIYTPGAPLLTYLLAWLSGRATSIPAYRMIQVGYTWLAVVVAAACRRRLVEMSQPAGRWREASLWGAVWLPTLFLIATNPTTNAFVYNLHNDALAQLGSVIAYWLLLKYISTPSKRVLAVMAIVPAAGFFVKQSLGIWALIYCAYLAFFERPRSVARLVRFTLAAGGAIGAVVGGCYLLWGDDFIYWVFTVLASHPFSLAQSFQHLQDSGAYLALGLLGGIVLLRPRNLNRLSAAWLAWLGLFLVEVYTSGIASMRNHIGPGSLIAGVWFVAALVRLWSPALAVPAVRFRLHAWLHAGTAVAVVGLLFVGLGFTRLPFKPLTGDAYRYVREIEQEFEGQSADTILLDAGAWIYLDKNVLVRDRVTSMGDRGVGGVGDFSGMIRRLEQRRYSKILVRHLHSDVFWYDSAGWTKPSGIRQALLENYHEIGRIAGVVGEQNRRYLFGEISILAPNPA